jgi:hypothetical protein
MSHEVASAERTESVLTAQGWELKTRWLKPVSGRIVRLTAAQIATPTAEMLDLIFDTFALDVAPYTRYRSTGTALIPEGGGSSSGETFAFSWMGF